MEGGKEGLKFENGAFTYDGVTRRFRLVPAVHPVPQLPGSAGGLRRLRELLLVPPRRALTDLQLVKVMRPQYLGAPVASRTPNPADSPNSIEPKIIPSSRTTLLNHRNTVPASS